MYRCDVNYESSPAFRRPRVADRVGSNRRAHCVRLPVSGTKLRFKIALPTTGIRAQGDFGRMQVDGALRRFDADPVKL
jgi:hypothetical protein